MNHSKIADVLVTARMLVNEFVAVQPGEQVLIVGDYDSDPITLDALAAATREAGGDPVTTTMPPREINGDPPPPFLQKAVLGADVIFAAASTDMLHSLSWGPGSKVRDLAERPWPLVEMSQATASVMVRPGARADYEEVGRIGD